MYEILSKYVAWLIQLSTHPVIFSHDDPGVQSPPQHNIWVPRPSSEGDWMPTLSPITFLLRFFRKWDLYTRRMLYSKQRHPVWWSVLDLKRPDRCLEHVAAGSSHGVNISSRSLYSRPILRFWWWANKYVFFFFLRGSVEHEHLQPWGIFFMCLPM